MEDELEVVFTPSPRVVLGEGPSWHERKQILYWIDIRGKLLFIYDAKTKTNQSIPLDQYIGCVVPAKNNELLLALEKGIHSYDTESKTLKKIFDPEEDKPLNRFNDGKIDPVGRFYAGTLEIAEKNGPLGALYVMGSDRTMTRVVDKVEVSNGLAWTSDNKTVYFIDSPTKKVDAFDYDITTGNFSNRRKVIDIVDGYPDGMTIDNEDMIWVAHWNGSKITRWNPKTGALLRTVQVPVSKVTSCCFGGPKLDQLYITTASYESDTSKEPLAGSLFILKNPGVTGRAEKEFAF